MSAIPCDIQDGRIVARISPREVDLIKQVPGMRWSPESEAWRAPVSMGVVWALSGVFGSRLVPSPALSEYVSESCSLNSEIQKTKTTTSPLWIDGGVRFGHQWSGARWLQSAQRCILGDEMGVGKTLTVITAARDLDRVVVVCPATIKSVWARELEKWTIDTPVHVAGRTAGQRRKAIDAWSEQGGWLIINYESLGKHIHLAGFGSIALSDKERERKELSGVQVDAAIFDEAHKILNPRAKMTRACWTLAHQSVNRWALTGTPVANNAADVWSLGHLTRPEDYPAKTRFIDRYADASFNIWGGLEVRGIRKDTEREFRQVFDPFFLRRTKAEVLSDLPAISYQEIVVEMQPKQKKAYESLKERSLALVEGGVLVADSPIVLSGRLRQAAAGTVSISEDGNVSAIGTPSCKIDALLDLYSGSSDDDPLVVFSESRLLAESAGEALEKAGARVGYITGSISESARSLYIDEFQAGDLDAIVCTTGAGGEGITLTRSRRLVFLQRPWSMVESEQAEGRVHRPGQTRGVMIYDIITVDTIESRVKEVLSEKGQYLDEITLDRERLLEVA